MAEPIKNQSVSDSGSESISPSNPLIQQLASSKSDGSDTEVITSETRTADRFEIFEKLALEQLRKGDEKTEPASFLPLPVRLTAISGALIAGLGVAWSILARVPLQVDGIAAIVPPGGLDSLTAPTTGILLFQVSGHGQTTLPIKQQEYNDLLREFWLNQATTFTQQVNASTKLEQLVRVALMRPPGQNLVVGTHQIASNGDRGGGGVPIQLTYAAGTVLAKIRNEPANQALNAALLSTLPAIRLQNQQARDRLARAGDLSHLGKLQSNQRETLREEIGQRQDLYSRYIRLWRQGYLPGTTVLEEQSRINNLESQLLTADSSQLNTRINRDEQLEQSAQVKVSKTNDLNNLETSLIHYLTTTTIFAPSNGFYILTSNFESGSHVQEGDEVITFMAKPPSLPRNIPLFLDSAAAQQVSEGMSVLLTPRGISRAKYGGIRGKVVEVNKLPLQGDGLQGTLGSRGLVSSIQQSIPTPFLVRIEIEQTTQINCLGASSFNCYKWSSGQRPPHPVRLASLAEVQVTTNHRAPIEFVMPFVRRALGLVVENR